MRLLFDEAVFPRKMLLQRQVSNGEKGFSQQKSEKAGAKLGFASGVTETEELGGTQPKMKQQKKMLLGLLFIVAALAIALAALTALNESNTSASEAEASANDVTLFSASEAVKLCYQYGEEVSLEKDTDGNWRLSGDDTTDLDQTIVDSMITAVCFFSPEQRIVNVTDLAQYGLAEPAVSIAVTTADGATYTVRMGDVNASTDDLYLALEDSLDTVYTVSKQKLAAFQYTAADLLKPATPETAEDATSGTEIGSGTENSIETAETATAETAAVEPVSGATTTE